MCITTNDGRIAKPESLIAVYDNQGLTEDRFCAVYKFGTSVIIGMIYLTSTSVGSHLTTNILDEEFDEFRTYNSCYRVHWYSLPTTIQKMIVETIKKEIF